MTRSWHIILFIFACLSSKGQTITFDSVYYLTSYSSGTSVIEEDSGYTVCGLGYSNQLSGFTGINIFKTDNYGNVLQQKVIGRSQTGHYPGPNGALKKLPDSNYILGAAVEFYDSAVVSRGLFLKLDSHFDTIWTYVYGNHNEDYFNDSYLSTDNNYLAVGLKGNASGSMVLVKLSPTGQVIWERAYGGNDIDVGVMVGEQEDGRIIIAGLTASFGNGSIDGYLVKTDSSGSLLWQKTIGKLGDDSEVRVRTTNDGGYLIWGSMDTITANGSSYLMKLDSDGEVVWKLFFNKDYRTQYGVLQAREVGKYIYIVGFYDTIQSGEIGWMAKFDSMGALIWQHFHRHVDSQISDFNYFYDFAPTRDGGFILTGSTEGVNTNGSGQQGVWLLKVDSLGCLTPGCDTLPCQLPPCDTVGIGETAFPKIWVYPNPATNHLTIELSTYTQPTTFALYDLLGRKALETVLESHRTELDITSLPDGLYLYKAGGAIGKVQVLR
ncbi:MAG: T9SS type A sorting domain-containing protein [Chitinophagales bacterium]|nr:T9SS type A sorting domain-containing protein [Chitinophagales bacterium]